MNGGSRGWIEELVVRLGEPAVGVLLALETILPPIPSEVVLPFAGFQAARGHLHPVGAWVAATAGSLAGAWVLYGVGAWFGRERLWALAAQRWFIVLGPRDLARGERFFAAHGGAVVLVGRCIPLVRSVVSVPAGIERMPPFRFSVLTGVGSGIWNAAFITAGWHLEDRWTTIERGVRPAAFVIAGVLLVLLAVTTARKRAGGARIRRRPEGGGPPRAGPPPVGPPPG